MSQGDGWRGVRLRSVAALLSFVATTAALLATSPPDGPSFQSASFRHEADGPTLTLDDATPTAAFAIRVRRLERVHDGRPFDAYVGLQVVAELEQRDGDAGATESVRWLRASLRPIEHPLAADAGLETPQVAPTRWLERFTLTTRVPLFGDCDVDAGAVPCEGVAVLSLESGGGPGALSVRWRLAVTGDVVSPEGGTIPAPIDVMVTRW